MAYKFTFEDGTTVEFEKFKDIERHQNIYGGQPGKIPGQSAGSISFYVNKEVYDWYRERQWSRNQPKPSPMTTNIQIGILCHKSAIGLPTGSYVPIKWNNAMNRFDVFLLGLTNEQLIVDDRIASMDTIEKVNKAIKEAAEEDAADVA